MALKTTKSFRPDKIPNKTNEGLIEAIFQPLAIVFNTSFQEGTFPDIWKIARVTSIFNQAKN